MATERHDGPGRDLRLHRAPPDLFEQAMARADSAPVSTPSPWPRRLALAATFLLGVGVGTLGDDRGSETPVAAEDAAQQTTAVVEAPPAASPQLVPVRLVFHAPGAGSVSVAGSFNGWDPLSHPMEAAEGGLFRAVIALPPGQHEYQFVVDGKEWVVDPSAALTRDDGFGMKNAVLEI